MAVGSRGDGSDPGNRASRVPACMTSAQRWSQTGWSLVLDNGTPEASTVCSKAEWFRGQTRWTGAWSSRQASVARTGNVDRPLSTANVAGSTIRYYARPQIELTSATCVVHGQRSERWITGLAGSSSPWELRAGHTGPMVIALPRLQTATTKRCENASASVKLNYRSLPVGPQRGKDDRREYVRGGGLHGW